MLKQSATRRPRVVSIFAWGLILVSVVFGSYSLVPPPAVTAEAPDEDFSADRALRHVEAIARRPHPMGTAARDEVRRYLTSEIEKLGLVPEFQAIWASDYYGSGEPVAVVNVMARIPGTSSTGAIALMAHYDTVPATPGANDNTSGVATVLETARAILSGSALRNDVLLLFTDSEEPAPRYGSNAFVSDHPVFDEIALVVNLEAVGGSGPSILGETSGPTGWLVERYAADAPNPTTFSFIAETMSLLGDIGTDFDPFRNAGVPGYHFAYMRGSSIYHSPADDVESVSRDSVQHHGSNTLAVTRSFGDADLTAMPDPDESVYFTLRPIFVRYPASWSVVAALAAGALLLPWIVRRRREEGRWWQIVRSGGLACLLVLVGALIGTLAWILVTTVRSSPTVRESYLSLIGVVSLGSGFAFWLNRVIPTRWQVDRCGFVLVWVGLGLLTAFVAPGFSPLFTLPALAAVIAINWRPGDSDVASLLRFGLVAMPTVVLLVPAVDFFFQMGQPRPGNPDSSIPSAAGVGFLLALFAIGLIWMVWPTSPHSERVSSPDGESP
ncbi:MAG: M20/M25/M40 family metallo-hydrolase [Acidimicrobiia bacterium]